MAKSPSTANWQTIDPTTLPTPIAKQYANYKSAYSEMKTERRAFEDAVTAMLTIPQGKRAVFGYNFGKLSLALVDDDAKPTTAKGSLSLSDFLTSQAAQGKRT